MKNKLLFTIAAILFAVSLNAQTELWSDDFTEGNAEGWTLSDIDADGFNWAIGGILQDDGSFNSTNVLATYCMDFSDFSWISTFQNNWAISPDISLEIGAGYYYGGTITLTINMQAGLYTYGGFPVDIYASTSPDFNDIENSFSKIESITLGTTSFSDYEFDLTDVAGNKTAGTNATLYIAMVNSRSGGAGYGLEVKTVSLSYTDLVEGSPTSISDETSNTSNLQVYPNPAKDNSYVTLTTPNNKGGMVNIYNITGKKVMQQFIDAGVSTATIDVDNLASGLYVIRFTDKDGKTEIVKLVK